MKKDVKTFLFMLLGAVIMFFALPLIVNLQPNEQISIYGTQLIYLILTPLFFGVIGWKARDFEKFGYLVPIPLLLIYMLFQILLMGGLFMELLLNAVEAAYMIYVLRKLMENMKKKNEAKNQPKPFPKSVKKR